MLYIFPNPPRRLSQSFHTGPCALFPQANIADASPRLLTPDSISHTSPVMPNILSWLPSVFHMKPNFLPTVHRAFHDLVPISLFSLLSHNCSPCALCFTPTHTVPEFCTLSAKDHFLGKSFLQHSQPCPVSPGLGWPSCQRTPLTSVCLQHCGSHTGIKVFFCFPVST